MDFYLKRGLACPVLVQEGETDAVKIAAGVLVLHFGKRYVQKKLKEEKP